MLTEKEECWLEGRKVLCPRCDHYRDHVEGRSACHRGEKGSWMQAECRFFQRKDLIPDYKDAAKFEGIVAMLLADPAPYRFRVVCPSNPNRVSICNLCKSIRKRARLDEDGNCIRKQLECRRMQAEFQAERYCDNGTRPIVCDYGELRLERSIKEEEQA